ncbi:MAG: hypothetical protein LC641_02290 [Spirochaeta sp.]|nr:hypothetical protein [Spirochaeta sp.]
MTNSAKITLPALFLLSATALAVEVSLTRLFSFLFVQSYVYVLISCSMAGVGAGAVVMYFVPHTKRSRVAGIMPLAPVLFLLFLFATNTIGTNLPLSLLATFAIFVSIGAMQVFVFRESGIQPGKLYAADLLGASIGSLLAFMSLNLFGAVTTLVVLGLLMGVALGILVFVLFGNKRRAILSSAGVGALAILTLFLSFDQRMLPTETWLKEMTVMLEDETENPRLAEHRWTAFGRVDVVETDNPFFKTMFIDGAAGTKLVRMVDGQVPQSVAQTLMFQYMGGIPLLAVEDYNRSSAVVIGSGGGIDVVTLLVAGFEHIDAVEINPGFIELVREQPEYTGGIYNNHPQVDVHLTEGRSFLRTSERQYDLVLMGLPIIKSVRNFGNHALTENYLFTSNAFSEYREVLKPDGIMIIIAHYRNELLKLVSNAVQSFVNDGLTPAEATERLISIGPSNNPTLILKDQPFTAQERLYFETLLRNLPVQGNTNFIPGMSTMDAVELGLHPRLVALSRGDLSLNEFVAAADENIAPITDEAPFFYQMSKTVPIELRVVGLVMLALITVICALFFLPRWKNTEEQITLSPVLLFFAFGTIGLGYMLIEIGILQKFIVFWQHQTLALSVVLASILVSSGVGSLLSERIHRSRVVMIIAGGIVALALASEVGLSAVLLSFETAAVPVKILLTLAFTMPLFLPMGIPFPFLLRETKKTLYPWMIGVNSLTTIAGGVLTMIIAMQFGYPSVLRLGAGMYVVLSGLMLLAFRATRKGA